MNPATFQTSVQAVSSFPALVSLCLDVVNEVEQASPTLAGQKRKYSDLRKSFDSPEALTLAKSLPWPSELSRVEFSNDVLSALTRQVWKAPESTLKAATVLALVKLAPADTGAYKSNQNRASKSAQLEGVEVNDPVDYIERARQLACSPYYTHKIIGIAALTGRRVFEVACQAEFEAVAPATVSFVGRAKNAKATDQATLIPTLIPAIEVVELLESLRSVRPDLVGLTDKQFNDKSSKTLNEVAKKKLGLAKPKDTRGIYAAICHTGINKRRSGQNAYYSMVLAHDEKDMSAKDYQKFFVPDQYINGLVSYFNNLIGE
jgi:negative regulator of replication initiation